VIDRLASDLKWAFPGMKGFSPRNLKYMRRFAEVWAEEEFVQQVAAQLPWFHNCVLLEKVSGRDERVWLCPGRYRVRLESSCPCPSD
jgi:predicted nuclease of restriction endonuclease-like (RecB) superfamily